MRRSTATAIFVLLAPAVYADFQASFRKGITALDRGKFGEAAAAMRSAIAENPTESPKKVFIYGTRYVEYTPHFHLGVALSRLNDCEAAVPALRASKQQGVITRTSASRQLEQILTACAGRESVTPRDNAVVQRPPDPAPTPVPPIPKPVPERNVAPAPTPFVPEKKPPVEPVIKQSASTTTNSVTAQPVRPDPAVTAARQKLSSLLTDGRKLLKVRGEASAAASREAATARATLTRAVNTASVVAGSASVQALQTAINDVTGASEDFRRALRAGTGEGVAPLADAVRAYMRGDYTRTTALLERASFEAAPARAQAALFRAAARYALFTLEGAKNEPLRKQALRDLQEYRRIAGKEPDPRLFPPPFRDLYATLR